MDFDGIKLIADEIKEKESFINNINNIYEKLSTNYCEYVDNINNIYNNMENVSKTFKTADNSQINNYTEILQQHYKNITENSCNADKYKGFGGYVDKIEDNFVNSVNNLEVIHKNDEFFKKSDFLDVNSVDNYSSEFKNYSDSIKNTENNNSYENNKYGVNINMGGITQNITSSADCNDVIDILVNKLRNAVYGCGSRIY